MAAVIDWLVAMDDMMTARLHHCLHHCTLCGKPPRTLDIRRVGPRGVCACLCERCLATYGWHAVDTLLAQRYQP